MLQRNWLDLSRKLVDRTDMNYSFTAVQQALGEYALAWFGEGAVITSQYPNPFNFTMSGSSLGGSVGNGTGFDINGQLTNITNSTQGSKNFTLAAASPSLPRLDLVCIKYVSAGDTPVPKPSDPLITVNLNLHDDFQLIVVQGTPNVSPVYPAKGNPLYIILAGIQVPGAATTGTQCTVDYSVREQANANLSQYPVVVQEVPVGAINGTNASFSLSQTPVNNSSLMVRLDGSTLRAGTDWSISGQVLTLSPVPAIGQTLDVWYIAANASSQSPLTGVQETPTGTANGSNTLFTLAGKPANQASTIVFVDGLEIPLEGWNLIQGTLADSIQFNAGYIPAIGQSVYAFYLANPFIFGAQPPTPPPTGTGGLVPHGSSISPILITASAGIPATSDQRQAWFIASSGGSVNVTAIPQVTAGTVVGQELDVFGTSPTNVIVLSNGNGLNLNGPVHLTDTDSISLVWNGAVWQEIGRQQ